MNVKFLIPLGLLGLLGIVALILIYIIKPNFQQKLLSSTFLWRLSLKFKKKKIPLSRLRNILLIACQVLIITAIAAILAKTIHVLKEKVTQPEVVLVIDSSASMRAGTEESTRYERAVEAAVRQAGETFDRDGIVSVILAGNDNRFLVERAYADSRDSVVGFSASIRRQKRMFTPTKIMRRKTTWSWSTLPIGPNGMQPFSAQPLILKITITPSGLKLSAMGGILTLVSIWRFSA